MADKYQCYARLKPGHDIDTLTLVVKAPTKIDAAVSFGAAMVQLGIKPTDVVYSSVMAVWGME